MTFNPSLSQEVSIPYGAELVSVRIPGANPLSVLTPSFLPACADPAAEIRRAIQYPIGAPPVAQALQGMSGRVVILADDLTRQTPVRLAIPVLLDELNRAGVPDDRVTVLIALGTHRPMTSQEIDAHFGAQTTRRVQVLNHAWQEPAQLVDLGTTPNGTPVQVNRIALDAGFLIGVGTIVPHHIPGYSAGAKIVQPGVTGAATTGATHYLSTRTRRSYLGMAENPVRKEIEGIAARAGLKAILNFVLNPDGSMVKAFYGDFIQAHRTGVETANRVYGVHCPAPADIVIAGSHPCDIEFWQAHKSLYPADMAVKAGGTIIVVTPCPEGVSVTHRGMLEFTSLPAEKIDSLIQDGALKDVVSGALALAWAKVRQRAEVCLVSGGIPETDAAALGFRRFSSVQEALDAALLRRARASVTVLTHAPDTLPIVGGG